MNRRALFIAGGIVVLGIGWALFRPELLFIDNSVNEAFPAATATSVLPAGTRPVQLASGQFHSNAHETRGTASIFELGDGTRALRLTNFETSNGPDVRVLLVAAPDVMDNDTVKNAGYIELGKLKGNIGDQNYDVPADLDLARYGAVTIWCNRFSVNFGTAPLSTSGTMDSASPQPKAVATGEFHSNAHETKGAATIHDLGDGRRILRLTGFETSNGPDVRVLLVAAGDVMDNDTVKNAGYVELGKLKGNIGDQNYDVPAGLDLTKYRAVTIWCNRFSVNFGTAPLRLQS